jgi:hypothetical protein
MNKNPTFLFFSLNFKGSAYKYSYFVFLANINILSILYILVKVAVRVGWTGILFAS